MRQTGGRAQTVTSMWAEREPQSRVPNSNRRSCKRFSIGGKSLPAKTEELQMRPTSALSVLTLLQFAIDNTRSSFNDLKSAIRGLTRSAFWDSQSPRRAAGPRAQGSRTPRRRPLNHGWRMRLVCVALVLNLLTWPGPSLFAEQLPVMASTSVEYTSQAALYLFNLVLLNF